MIFSKAGKRPFPGLATYSMTKAGLDMLTNFMALELGAQKISVKSINLGLIDTDMGEEAREAVADAEGVPVDQLFAAFQQRVPLGESYVPMEQVVNAVLFAASTPFLAGSTLTVDGGYLLS